MHAAPRRISDSGAEGIRHPSSCPDSNPLGSPQCRRTHSAAGPPPPWGASESCAGSSTTNRRSGGSRDVVRSGASSSALTAARRAWRAGARCPEPQSESEPWAGDSSTAQCGGEPNTPRLVCEDTQSWASPAFSVSSGGAGFGEAGLSPNIRPKPLCGVRRSSGRVFNIPLCLFSRCSEGMPGGGDADTVDPDIHSRSGRLRTDDNGGLFCCRRPCARAGCPHGVVP